MNKISKTVERVEVYQVKYDTHAKEVEKIFRNPIERVVEPIVLKAYYNVILVDSPIVFSP